MVKYGIKIWSRNKEWFGEAVDIVKSGKADFIELYIVPGSFDKKDFKILKQVSIIIHAPYFSHNFNIFNLDKDMEDMFKKDIIASADFFNSKYIIVHAGVGENQDIFKENIAKIKDKRIIIENMTKFGLADGVHFGYSLKQLQFVKQDCGFDICLDLAHAEKSAFSQKIDYLKFIKELISKLQPNYFHISDDHFESDIDNHLNLGEGDLDLKEIKSILIKYASHRDIYLVFETPKQDDNLQNDLKNINYFKKL